MGAFVTIYNYIGFRLAAPPFSLDQSAIGAIFAVYLVGSAASAIMGRLADRYGRRNVLWISEAIFLAGVLITLGAHSVASSWVGRRATIFAYYLGSSVLGSLGGVVFGAAGWTGTVVAVAALALALIIAVFVLRVVTPAARARGGKSRLEFSKGRDDDAAIRARTLHPDLECLLFSEAEIGAAIRSLAERIAGDHVGEDVLLLGVLKGAVHVLSDLARELDGIQPGPSRLYLDVMAVSSYGNASRSSGEVRLIQDTTHAIEGRRVVIVEDIIDNGLTLSYLNALLSARKPLALRSAVLLDKPYRRIANVKADYVGLTCPDEFIVGYGLDYQERYRTLPYIAKLRPDIFSEPE